MTLIEQVYILMLGGVLLVLCFLAFHKKNKKK